jgi:hypothetical protein
MTDIFLPDLRPVLNNGRCFLPDLLTPFLKRFRFYGKSLDAINTLYIFRLDYKISLL